MATHGYEFTWTDSTGTITIRGAGFDTPAEADETLKTALDAFGYQPPKWWQFWRWGEPLPGPYRNA